MRLLTEKQTFPEEADITGSQGDDEYNDSEELEGGVGGEDHFDGLAQTLMDDDGQKMKDAQMLEEAMNYNVNAFVPDVMFEKMTQNYQLAEKIYGPKLLREISGYSNQQLEKNSKVPEFQRELKNKLGSRIKSMKKSGLLEKDGTFSEDAVPLASLVLLAKEIDHLHPSALFGKHVHKHIKDPYGVRGDTRPLRSGDRFMDIDVRQSVKTAIRRGHTKLQKGDLRVNDRYREGRITVIYAIDASGSMKGKKIEMAKRAGVALAYKATMEKNKVGLVVFGSEVQAEVAPTKKFTSLLEPLTTIAANKETNMVLMLEAVEKMFASISGAKHLIVLTDGMPTVGDDPERMALEKVAEVRAAGITVSMIGLQLHPDDEAFAREFVDFGGGKLRVVRDIENVDVIVLEDYDSMS